jgi:hypothetical protein
VLGGYPSIQLGALPGWQFVSQNLASTDKGATAPPQWHSRAQIASEPLLHLIDWGQTPPMGSDPSVQEPADCDTAGLQFKSYAGAAPTNVAHVPPCVVLLEPHLHCMEQLARSVPHNGTAGHRPDLEIWILES